MRFHWFIPVVRGPGIGIRGGAVSHIRTTSSGVSPKASLIRLLISFSKVRASAATARAGWMDRTYSSRMFASPAADNGFFFPRTFSDFCNQRIAVEIGGRLQLHARLGNLILHPKPIQQGVTCLPLSVNDVDNAVDGCFRLASDQIAGTCDGQGLHEESHRRQSFVFHVR